MNSHSVLQTAVRSVVFSSTFLCFTVCSFGQYHKEKCIVGNCKTGNGINRIEGNKKKPLPFDLASPWAAGYYYYEVGDFKSGQLSGSGYRVSLLGDRTRMENWLVDFVKSKNPFIPEARFCGWFESGVYDGGVLNGRGALLEFDALNNRPYRIREGSFKNGLLNGDGIKIIPTQDGFFGVEKDQSNGKYKILYGRLFQGKFVDDVCTDCALTEIKTTAGEGTTKGKILQETFLSGWVTKDFEVDAGSGKYKPTEPYKALYIGSVEIARVPSYDLSKNIKTLTLPDGTTYIGEVDGNGQAYGFGTIVLSGNPAGTGNYWFYEGFVDNGKPEGWGYVGNNTPLGIVRGGYFRNNILMHGAQLKSMGDPELLLFGDKSGNVDPHYNTYLQTVLDGPYTQRFYRYEPNKRIYTLTREASGDKVNGYERNVWVSKGLSIEEKRRQRANNNGLISISDLTIGDIIVLGGMASPVVSETGGLFYLKNDKKVSPASANQVQLSKHVSSEFHQSCQQCKGGGQTTYEYQRPPEQVELVRHSYQTEVLDYTIVRKTITHTSTYTKTFPPEKRVKTCDACQGKGYSQDLAELVE